MSDADLSARIGGLMPRARRDLTELVAFRSVAGPSEFPPEECDRAASWLVDALADAGLTEVAAHETADGSKAVLGHRPAPAGAPTVLSTATTTWSHRSPRMPGRPPPSS
jgi:acetylornithine deacetylase/succinyl-diaminopimelate desuccinylase-like protein